RTAWAGRERRAGAADEEGSSRRRAGDVAVAYLTRLDHAVATVRRRREGRAGRRGGRRPGRSFGERDDAAPNPHVGCHQPALDFTAAAEAHAGKRGADLSPEQALAGEAYEGSRDEHADLLGRDAGQGIGAKLRSGARGEAVGDEDVRRAGELDAGAAR